MPRAAIIAAPAVVEERQHHPVADLQPGDVRPQFLDIGRGLVPQHDRQRRGPGAFDPGHVAVTDAAGGKADADFAGLRRQEVDVLKAQRFTITA